MEHAIILHNPVTASSKEDELDVLDQAELIEEALAELGYSFERIEFNLNIPELMDRIKLKAPFIVFNLVETINNQGKLSFVAPAMLEAFGFKFTGSLSEAIYSTTNKTICKSILQSNNINTPVWAKNILEIDPLKTYIIKPVSEDGSVGIDDNILFQGDEIKNIGEDFFAEEYIDGREFNISIIGNAPEVLPPAEMCFNNYPPSRPRILGYKSKWEENSFEYKNTTRSFNFGQEDFSLLEELKGIALKCWKLFNLKGYARVDIRVGHDHIPKVIEINANPCISPESGFVAACRQAGMDNTEIIKRIIKDAH